MFCDQDAVWLENKVKLQVAEIDNSNYNENIPIVDFHDLILTNSESVVISKSFWALKNLI